MASLLSVITGVEGGWERRNDDGGGGKIRLSPAAVLFISPPPVMGTLRSSLYLPIPTTPSRHNLTLPPSEPGEGLSLARARYQATIPSPLLHLHSGGCSRRTAIISQPPTSNLCISKPSVAQAQPTPQLGSAQLVITGHYSSETSHFSLFRKKVEEDGASMESCNWKLAITPVATAFKASLILAEGVI